MNENLQRYREERKKSLTERDIEILKAINEVREAQPYGTSVNLFSTPKLKQLGLTHDEITSLKWRGFLDYSFIGIVLTTKGREAIKKKEAKQP